MFGLVGTLLENGSSWLTYGQALSLCWPQQEHSTSNMIRRVLLIVNCELSARRWDMIYLLWL